MDVPRQARVIADIEAFLERHSMAETRFGRDASGEAQLLKSMRRGRSPSLNTINRVADFMRERDAAAGFGHCETDHPATDTTLVEHDHA